MKISLKPDTVEKIEDITKKKITRNGDQIISELCEKAEKKPDCDCWTEPLQHEEKEDQ